jgi:hypothetical protein
MPFSNQPLCLIRRASWPSFTSDDMSPERYCHATIQLHPSIRPPAISQRSAHQDGSTIAATMRAPPPPSKPPSAPCDLQQQHRSVSREASMGDGRLHTHTHTHTRFFLILDNPRLLCWCLELALSLPLTGSGPTLLPPTLFRPPRLASVPLRPPSTLALPFSA